MSKKTECLLTSSFSYKHYHPGLNAFKSKALGWLVQFAIRADLKLALSEEVKLDTNEYRSRSYFKLQENAPRLRDLILRKHIIDEADLNQIGMTGYDFPCLSHFFVATDMHRFVREPRTHEVAGYLCEMYALLEDADSSEFRLEEATFAIKHKNRSQIEEEVQQPNELRSRHRLLWVDMVAPVSVLKAQFLEILERAAKQKNSIEVLVDTWLRYGVLPFIDMRDWISCERKRWIRSVRRPRSFLTKTRNIGASIVKAANWTAVRKRLMTSQSAML